MKTVIVASDVYGFNSGAGGIAIWVRNFSELLSSNGHEVNILYSGDETDTLDSAAEAYYKSLGIDVNQITILQDKIPSWYPFTQRQQSEAVADHVRDADIVYFRDWGANGFNLVRERRFSDKQYPICVAVMAGCNRWINYYQQRHPTIPDELLLDFMEGYSVKHSDFIVSPSQFMLDWIHEHGWRFLEDGSPRVMNHPFTKSYTETIVQHQTEYRQIVFFGRLDTGKGFDLFIETLLSAKLKQEIVFLGYDNHHQYDTAENAADILQEVGYTVTLMTNLNSLEAQAYLAEHIADTLVVMPSLLDNFPFVVIEASHISGLNFICSNHGGQPEIIGTETGQLFAPNSRDFKRVLLEWIEHGPRPADQLGRYPAEEANQRWLDFHEEMIDHAKSRQQPITPLPSRPDNKPIVDICIAHHNHADYLPDMLRSLEYQTVTNFNVIVIDDGSTDPRALDVFRTMQQRYPQWTFIEQDNRFVDATRNNAVRLGTAEYIIFFDSDDIAAPNMVERYVEAIRHSGDDCIYSYAYEFKELIDSDDGKPPSPIPCEVYKPFGAELISGLLKNIIGSGAIIIRRTVFEEIGGYTEQYQIPWEDFELLIRLIMKGYKYDVLPEALYYHRYVENSLSHRKDLYLAEMRALTVYEDALETIGLRGLAQAFRSLYAHNPNNNTNLENLMEINEQLEAGHILSRRYIKNLESRVESLKQQVDTHQHRIHQPSIKDVLQMLYRLVIPMSLRLRFQQIHQSKPEL